MGAGAGRGSRMDAGGERKGAEGDDWRGCVVVVVVSPKPPAARAELRPAPEHPLRDRDVTESGFGM